MIYARMRVSVKLMIVFMVLGQFAVLQSYGQTRCLKGDYLIVDKRSGHETCEPCQLGVTYMDESCHRHTSCKPCSNVFLGRLQEVSEPCTLTSDRLIGCVNGSYRHSIHPFLKTPQCRLCMPCKDGELEIKACTRYHNAECIQANSSEDTTDSSDNQINCPTVTSEPTVCSDEHRTTQTHLPKESNTCEYDYPCYGLYVTVPILIIIIIILLMYILKHHW